MGFSPVWPIICVLPQRGCPAYNGTGVFAMKPTARRMLDAFLGMHELSWWIFTRALCLSCVLLFCGFVLLLEVDTVTLDNLRIYRIAQSMTQLPQVVLLIGIIGVACAEDHFTGT